MKTLKPEPDVTDLLTMYPSLTLEVAEHMHRMLTDLRKTQAALADANATIRRLEDEREVLRARLAEARQQRDSEVSDV